MKELLQKLENFYQQVREVNVYNYGLKPYIHEQWCKTILDLQEDVKKLLEKSKKQEDPKPEKS